MWRTCEFRAHGPFGLLERATERRRGTARQSAVCPSATSRSARCDIALREIAEIWRPYWPPRQLSNARAKKNASFPPSPPPFTFRAASVPTRRNSRHERSGTPDGAPTRTRSPRPLARSKLTLSQLAGCSISHTRLIGFYRRPDDTTARQPVDRSQHDFAAAHSRDQRGATSPPVQSRLITARSLRIEMKVASTSERQLRRADAHHARHTRGNCIAAVAPRALTLAAHFPPPPPFALREHVTSAPSRGRRRRLHYL